VTFALAIERPWCDAWPIVAQTGDGNAWLTGACWLYCRREGVRMLWVGSVSTPGATGDVYACGPCIAELDHMVRVQSHGRDTHAERAQSATLTVPAHAPRRALCPRARPAVTGCPAASGTDPPQLYRWEDAMTKTETCDHRQTEKRDGKTYCRTCKRQLYL
jgi:hypothetical protein